MEFRSREQVVDFERVQTALRLAPDEASFRSVTSILCALMYRSLSRITRF